jgi:putative ubiquitin-RnfH superfamily antitoxin RatB of RatAB toxin-antitoxin module
LHDLDRVEIYRELIAEPKQARRQRARQQRATRRNR